MNALVGMTAWEISVDRHEWLILKFGARLSRPDGDTDGEWELQIAHCVWRLQTPDRILVANGDIETNEGSPVVPEALRQITTVPIRAVHIALPSFQTLIEFEGRLELHLFPVHTHRFEHWLLFRPDHRLVVVGPGGEWSYGEEDWAAE